MPEPDEWGRYLRLWAPRVSLRKLRRDRGFLKEQLSLTEDTLDRLFCSFILKEVSEGVPKSRRGAGWQAWALDVLAIKVDLYPNGRARLRQPKASYSVEMRWGPIGKDSRGKPEIAPKSLQFIGDDSLTQRRFDTDLYFAAFMLALTVDENATKAFGRFPPARPEPGRPANTGFYRQLQASYDALIAAGEKDPAKQLAQQMGANHQTVKSWLRRGRDYLKETEKGS